MNWLPVEITVAATADSVTLGMARDWVKVDTNDDDARLIGLIKAAQRHIEQVTGLRLFTQTVKMRGDGFANIMRLPIAPIQSLTSIKYLDGSGVQQTLSGDVYNSSLYGMSPVITLAYGQSWPTVYSSIEAIEIIAVAGFGGLNDQPEDLRLATLMTVGHLFDNPAADKLPGVVFDLLTNSRMYA